MQGDRRLIINLDPNATEPRFIPRALYGRPERRKRRGEEMKNYVAKERLYFTDDRTRVVKESDPDSAFVFLGPGQECSEAEARKYGLLDEPEAKAISKPAENKAVGAPPEVKKLSGDLPADFPNYSDLHKAGIDSYEELAVHANDYTEIDKVGPAGAKAIGERVAKETAALKK